MEHGLSVRYAHRPTSMTTWSSHEAGVAKMTALNSPHVPFIDHLQMRRTCTTESGKCTVRKPS